MLMVDSKAVLILTGNSLAIATQVTFLLKPIQSQHVLILMIVLLRIVPARVLVKMPKVAFLANVILDTNKQEHIYHMI